MIRSTSLRRAMLVGTAVSMGLTTATATPSSAQTDSATPRKSVVSLASDTSKASSDCPGKTLCLWDDRNYSGKPFLKVKTLGIHATGWSNNDDASSGWNKTLYTAWLYFNANGGGTRYCLPSGYTAGNFSDYEGLNDEISSVGLFDDTGCPSGSATIGHFKGY